MRLTIKRTFMKVLLFLFMSVPLLCFSQIKHQYSFNDEGEVFYEEIVIAKDFTKIELFSKAKILFAENFKSGKNTIDIEDSESGTIIGKGTTIIPENDKKLSINIYLNYTIKIECKDGKFRYSIYNFSLSNNMNSMENNLNESHFNFVEQQYKKANKKMQEQMIEKNRIIVSNIKQIQELIKKSLLSNNNNDW